MSDNDGKLGIEDFDKSSNRLDVTNDRSRGGFGLSSTLRVDDSPEHKPKTNFFAKDSPPQGNKKKQPGNFVSDGANNFGLSKNDLVVLFDKYGRNQSFDEDILHINVLGDTFGICSKLKTDVSRGLSSNDKVDYNKRIEDFGENRFPEDEMPHCCEYVWEGLEDTMVRILICAAIFQIIVGLIPALRESPNDWIEGMSIIFAVVVVVSTGSIVNFTKEKKFRELNETNNNLVKITARRDGSVVDIKEEDIVVGDIVKLSYGMIIPADGYLVEGNEIKCDESPLTGESDLIEKEIIEVCEKRAEEEIEMNKGVKPKEKHAIPSPLVLSGTQVSEGQGWFLVLRVGEFSEKGKIRVQVDAEKKGGGKKADSDEKQAEGEGKAKEGEEETGDDDEGKTPLELKLEDLAGDISNFGILSACCTFVALIARLIYAEVARSVNDKNMKYERSNWANTTLFDYRKQKETTTPLHIVVEIIRIIILCVAVIVVAIPEGLPLAVTLTLAFSIGKMMDDQNLVRKMNACETMGGANYICSDKTGTLTRNEMSVNLFFNCEKIINFDKLTNDKSNVESPTNYFDDKYYDMLRLACTLNIEAELNDREEIVKASKTDVAFVELLHNFGEKLNKIREIYFPKKESGETLKRFPFTSSRKKMSTIISNKKFETGNIIFQKGASEIVLNSCQYYLEKDGRREKITDEKKQNFEKTIKQFADLALRTICVAFKNVNDKEADNWKDKATDSTNIIENEGFCLIGIFGIKDKLRDGVPEAVEICRKAGIKVVMVTGDNIDTAVAIAKECNIITPEVEKEGGVISLTGSDFSAKIGGMVCDSCGEQLKFCPCARSEAGAEAIREKKKKLNPNFNEEIKIRKERIVRKDVFRKIYKNLRVIARSRPEDKYTMVYGLRELGHIVAVTGDGTNDAPALSKSNVGFAMGIAGTDIAKQAADIIILNDNFATIVQAVKWGRNIYDNIRKFVQFQLTVNLCACLLVFLTSCIGNETPLGAIQMLWLNMIMDSLGSLALATEPPNENLLNRQPSPKKEYIINSLMWKHIVFQALIQLMLLLILYMSGHTFIPETNEKSIEIAQQLQKCFGVIPGQKDAAVQNPKMMIAGPSLYWPAEVERLPEATPKDCGSFFTMKNLEEAKPFYLGIYGSSHLTLVFNSFVLYTLFNQVNVRVIDGSYNIFVDIHKNWMFVTLLLAELLLQVIIIQTTGIVFKVSIYGLDGNQWGASFIFGVLTFLVSLILKPIPLEKCFEACKRKEEEEEEEDFLDDIDKQIELKNLQVTNNRLEIVAVNNSITRKTKPDKKDEMKSSSSLGLSLRKSKKDLVKVSKKQESKLRSTIKDEI